MSLTWADVRQKIADLAIERGEWAGLPMPLSGLALTVEDKYPWKSLQNARLDPQPIDVPDGWRIVNHWKSVERGCQVWIVRNDDTGKTEAIRRPLVGADRLTMQLDTILASQAWDRNAEMMAVLKLKALLAHKEAMFDAYVMTGMFLETSKRSGVTYIFRRVRPTLALSGGDTGTKILAALCLHPIGYYQQTFAGVMVPTDDVIAHLLLMRGDERRFWAMANQHSAYSLEAGI